MMAKGFKKKDESETEDWSHSSSKVVAKKDFLIVYNDYRREIKAGDDLSDVPPMFHQNLKTEGIL